MSLEDAYDLFDKAGFQDVRMYSRKDIGYYKVSKAMVLKNAAWQFWQIGLSPDLVDRIAQKFVEEAQKESNAKGWKSTQELIVAHGTKPS